MFALHGHWKLALRLTIKVSRASFAGKRLRVDLLL
jgi:hypothetical protein